MKDAGFPTTPFRRVASQDEVLQAGAELGWPLVLKTATSGYDGKGQVIVRSVDQLPEAWKRYADCEVIAEKMIEFQAEVSMITARNIRGDMVSYPLFENSHENHILDVTQCPASPDLQEFDSAAREICQGLAESFSRRGPVLR